MDQFLEWTLHADEYIGELIKNYGGWTYLILCLIIFVETGLVVVAFFPGAYSFDRTTDRGHHSGQYVQFLHRPFLRG